LSVGHINLILFLFVFLIVQPEDTIDISDFSYYREQLPHDAPGINMFGVRL